MAHSSQGSFAAAPFGLTLSFEMRFDEVMKTITFKKRSGFGADIRFWCAKGFKLIQSYSKGSSVVRYLANLDTVLEQARMKLCETERLFQCSNETSVSWQVVLEMSKLKGN